MKVSHVLQIHTSLPIDRTSDVTHFKTFVPELVDKKVNLV